MLRQNRNKFSFGVREVIDELEDSELEEIENFILQHKPETRTQTHDRLSFNSETKQVKIDDEPLRLTKKEYAVLHLLFLRRGQTVTKEMFMSFLYGGMDEPELKVIDVFIFKIRRKIRWMTGNETYIKTVRGCGYYLPKSYTPEPSQTFLVEERPSK